MTTEDWWLKQTNFKAGGNAIEPATHLVHTVWPSPLLPIVLFAKGLCTPWAMKLSQGPMKSVIGSFTSPGSTLVYNKDKILE